MARHHRSVIAGTCAAALIVVTGCGGGSSASSSVANSGGAPSSAAAYAAPQSLIDAAKKEGKVVWYSATDETVVAALSKAFQEKYGIETQYIRLTSSTIATRYQAEAKSGKVNADLVDVSNGSFALQGEANGTFLSASKVVPGFPFPGYNPKFVHEDEGAPAEAIPLKSIAYNTDQVSGSDIPKDWKDLLDPKWKGKILFADPASSDSYVQFYDVLIKKYGADFLKKLAAQGLRVYNGTVPLVQALGAGEGAIAVPPTIDEVTGLAGKGAPIKYIIPPVDSGSEHVLCISAKAPHPNAAKLLAHFLLSPEGAKLQERPGTVTPYDDKSLPAQYTPVSLTDIDQQAAEVKQAFASLGK